MRHDTAVIINHTCTNMSACDVDFKPSALDVSECRQTPAIPTAPDDVATHRGPVLAMLGLPEDCQSGSAGSIGCAHIESMTRRYLATKAVLSCVIRRVANCSRQNVRIIQDIHIDNRAGGIIDCSCAGVTCSKTGGLNISQMSDVTSIHAAQFSDIYQDIGDTVTDLAKAIVNELSVVQPTSAASYFAQPDSAAAVLKAQASLHTNAGNIQWSNIVNTAIQDVYVEQHIALINYGLISGDGCSITQEVVANIVADHIISNGIRETFNGPGVTELLTSLKSHDGATQVPATQGSRLMVFLITMAIVLLLLVVGLVIVLVRV
jgi:hypothetical protein